MAHFNWIHYSELNPDLKIAGLTTQEDFNNHFRTYGKNENINYNIYTVYT